MNSILEYIQNIFLQFLNNENYISLISIIVVAITTYYVTKYTTLKPSHLAIKQAQLENIYLPLHLVFRNLPQSISQSNALVYSKKISNILDRHYLLAFPQLHQLNQMLKSDIINNSDYEKILRIMKHQVDIDYELLKKRLGYPSENFHNIFIRMTFRQKAEFIVAWLNVFWMLIPIILFFILVPYFENDVAFTLVIFLITSIFFFLMLKINHLVKKIKY